MRQRSRLSLMEGTWSSGSRFQHWKLTINSTFLGVSSPEVFPKTITWLNNNTTLPFNALGHSDMQHLRSH